MRGRGARAAAAIAADVIAELNRLFLEASTGEQTPDGRPGTSRQGRV